MPSLAEFQGAFAEYLGARPGIEPQQGLTGMMANGIASRLAVYRNNVAVRFIDALADTYAATQRLVGAEFFRFAALEYSAANPATSHTLLHYGGGFPEFLAAFEPARSVPYLADVARLEWLYVEAYHAAEATPLVNLDSAAFRLHSSARLMATPWPASRIWEVNCGDDPVGNEEIGAGPEHLMIIRPRALVEVRRLSAHCHALMAALTGETNYSGLLARAVEIDPDWNPRADIAALTRGGTFVEAL